MIRPGDLQWYRTAIRPWGNPTARLHMLIADIRVAYGRGEPPPDICVLSYPSERGGYVVVMTQAARNALLAERPHEHLEPIDSLPGSEAITLRLGEDSWSDHLRMIQRW